MGRKRRGGGAVPAVLPPGVAPFAVADGVDNFLELESGATTSTVAQVSDLLVGGYYQIPRLLEFNRLIVRVSAVSVAGSLLVAGVYQAADGLSENPCQRVQTYTATINAGGNIVMTGDCVLAPGLAVVAVGTTGAASDFSYLTLNIGLTALLNGALDAGMRPAVFTTAIPTTDPPPASLDCREGADTTATANDVAPCVRVMRV